MNFSEGQNCWRKTTFDRSSLIVDAGNYFQDLLHTLPCATKSIYILGWDFDSRIALNADNENPVTPFSLFSALVEKRPDLQIYVLIWCSNWVYTLKRELLTRWRIPNNLKNHLHLVFDMEFPMTGSHHQKIVVIDDRISYCGGMDITKGRWDLPAHLPHDPRRMTPDGEPFSPYHDVMLRMEGDVSRHLGELFRERWKAATKLPVEPPGPRTAVMDERIQWETGHAGCAITRTFPKFKDQEPVAETFQMYRELIAEARNHIYIENQYLTSRDITEMLCRRLRESDGPAVTVILPKKSERGLGNRMLMLHRAVMLRRLREADRHNRLGLYAPIVGRKVPVYIHSKLMIIDDRYALIGSSNLTDRSMGLDSECDIVIDAATSPQNRSLLLQWKSRLLGEHLGVPAESVQAQIVDWSECNEWIAMQKKDRRYLLPLWANKLTDWERRVVAWKMADYRNPLHIDAMIDVLRTIVSKPTPLWRNAFILTGTLLGLLLFAGVVISNIPLRDFIGTVLGSEEFLAIQNTRFSLLWMCLVFVAAGLLCVPMNVVMLTTATVFTAPWATLYILTGMTASACVNYFVGHLFGQEILQRLFTRSFDRVSRAIREKELVSFAVLRMIPVAPAGVINYIAGAYHVRFRPYITGTFLGILPGTFLLVLFQRTLVQTILEPSLSHILSLFACSLLLWGIAVFFRRRL